MIFGCLFVLAIFFLVFGFVRMVHADLGGFMVPTGTILLIFAMIVLAVFGVNNSLECTYHTSSDPNYPTYAVHVTDIKNYVDTGVLSSNMEYLIDNHHYTPETFVDDYLAQKSTLQGYVEVNKHFGNSLNEFWQTELGVEPADNTSLVVVLVILLISTVAVPVVWYNIYEDNISFDWIHEHDWFYIKGYKSFINPRSRYTYVKIKFKVFEELFNSFSITEMSPWYEIDARLLVLNTKSMPQLDTQNRYYQITFSYLDYLRYLYFLSARENYKNAVAARNTATTIKKNTLDFCQDVQAMLKEEGKRPWKDLMK